MTAHPPSPLSNLLWAFTGCVGVIAWLSLTHEGLAHWFLAPVLVCGVLIGQDAVEYLRGRLGMFDPVGVIGLFGVHFFFLAPLLHVAWDSYLEPWIEQPADWRPWLGWMAAINAVSLCAYQAARRRAVRWGGTAPAPTMWRVDRTRLLWACLFGLLVSGAMQTYFYAQSGGILAYIDKIGASIGVAEDEQADRGMGILFMVSDTFPILAMMLYALLSERKKWARSLLVVLVALSVFFVLKLYFGGLRGSRSAIIWGLFWGAGIVHLWVRPLTRQFVFTGLCFLVAFMYLYGFYKGLGKDVVAAFEEGTLTEKSQRRMDTMLLGDLGRADVQALVLERIVRPESDYRLAWGRTYVGSIGLLVPRGFWPYRPPIKTKEGTDAYYGPGAYEAGVWYSSKVYGIAGETMLNFGPWPVPLGYLLLGLFVGRLQRFLLRIDARDARLLVFPFLVTQCFSIIQSDTDNLIFNTVKDGLVPCAVVFVGARRVVRPSPRFPGPRKSHDLPEPALVPA